MTTSTPIVPEVAPGGSEVRDPAVVMPRETVAAAGDDHEAPPSSGRRSRCWKQESRHPRQALTGLHECELSVNLTA